uniref:Uncharacterized protein n=1 Tax=Rhizophora mucronata TaxID=61149 RepID=A0A2P2NRF3_RHIMU
MVLYLGFHSGKFSSEIIIFIGMYICSDCSRNHVPETN